MLSITKTSLIHYKILAGIVLASMVLLFTILQPARAEGFTTNIVDLEQSSTTLVIGQETLQPDSEILAGLHIKLQPHWHTYTYNAGDSGIPVSIQWHLPEGFKASDIYWPKHEVFNEAGLTTYGFSDEVVLTTRIQIPSDIPDISNIKAKVEYLVCKDICIPQTAEVELSLAKGDGVAGVNAEFLKEWHEASALAPADGSIGEKKTSSVSESATETQTTNETSNVTLLAAIALALLGGLILNLMPCVFPVLSLKALAIAKHAELSPKTIRNEGLAYTLGVLTCFWGLAILLIILQQSGAVIGWGFQFQNPAFVGLMAVLLFVIGLNLSGIFELPVLLGNVASKFGAADSLKGSYATGLLAALVATPCTAPFMATAVGAALSQPAYFSLTVFTALGLGLALPFLLLSFVPKLLKFLPKPGAWMERFKHFLAFPMYLSAIWLLWVVGTQTGIVGMAFVLCIVTGVIFIFWAKSCAFNGWFCKVATSLIIIALLVTLADGLNKLGDMQQSQIKSLAFSVDYAPYSKAKLEELRAQNIPVFVDATASWCITCQVNKVSAIRTETVQAAFKQYDVVFMEADWTNKDEEITEFLSSFGYRGVPLYVYYAPNKAGVVLPQILTPQIIVDAIQPTKE